MQVEKQVPGGLKVGKGQTSRRYIGGGVGCGVGGGRIVAASEMLRPSVEACWQAKGCTPVCKK